MNYLFGISQSYDGIEAYPFMIPLWLLLLKICIKLCYKFLSCVSYLRPIEHSIVDSGGYGL